MEIPIDYGHEALTGLPRQMLPWGCYIERPVPSAFGEYVVVEVSPADIELHHQVELIDESGEPLRGVWVIFGYPGDGPEINLRPVENHWRGSPQVMRGNAQRTNALGYAQHTYNDGGEDIFVWDIDQDAVLRLPSPIVRNCNWVGTPTGQFEHTGVKVRFQRRKAGVKPRSAKIAEALLRCTVLERRVAELEQQLKIAQRRQQAQTRAAWRGPGGE